MDPQTRAWIQEYFDPRGTMRRLVDQKTITRENLDRMAALSAYCSDTFSRIGGNGPTVEQWSEYLTEILEEAGA